MDNTRMPATRTTDSAQRGDFYNTDGGFAGEVAYRFESADSETVDGTSRLLKGKQRATTKPVANACVNCRRAKAKCSGKHPACWRCNDRGIDCQYDVSEEGISKLQDVRQKLQSQTGAIDVLHSVVDTLRHTSDEVATEVLARLRLGQSLEEILNRLRELRVMPSVVNSGTAWHNERYAAQQRPLQSASTRRDSNHASSGVYYQSMSSPSSASGYATSSRQERRAFSGQNSHGFNVR